MEVLTGYHTTIIVIGLIGLLTLFQLVIADVVAITQKHVPGYPVENSHDQFLFRATRAYLNTNETLSVFILFVLFSVLSGADPNVVNMSALAYLLSRIAHMVFYYTNLKLARSIAFGASLLSLLTMFFSGAINWL